MLLSRNVNSQSANQIQNRQLHQRWVPLLYSATRNIKRFVWLSTVSLKCDKEREPSDSTLTLKHYLAFKSVDVNKCIILASDAKNLNWNYAESQDNLLFQNCRHVCLYMMWSSSVHPNQCHQKRIICNQIQFLYIQMRQYHFFSLLPWTANSLSSLSWHFAPTDWRD